MSTSTGPTPTSTPVPTAEAWPCGQNESISCERAGQVKDDWTRDAYLIAAIVMFSLGGLLLIIGLIRLIWWCLLPKKPKAEKESPPEYYFSVEGQGTLASRHSLHRPVVSPMSPVTTLSRQDHSYDTSHSQSNKSPKRGSKYRYMIRYVESRPDGPYYVAYPPEYLQKLGATSDFNGQHVLWY